MGKADITIDIEDELAPIVDSLTAIRKRLDVLEVVTQAQRPAYRKSEAARLIGVSEPFLDRYIASGDLKVRELGERARIIMYDDLMAFLRGLPVVTTTTTENPDDHSRPTDRIYPRRHIA